MLGKFGILAVILILVFLFKGEKSPEIKKYLKSVNILLIVIAVVGTILVFFL